MNVLVQIANKMGLQKKMLSTSGVNIWVSSILIHGVGNEGELGNMLRTEFYYFY
jgi:hypothetical protein